MSDTTTSEEKYDFNIVLQPDYSLLEVRLGEEQKIYAEPSAMASMDTEVSLKSGLKGGLFKSIGRAFGGESLIVNTFRSKKAGAEVTFAPGPMGDLHHYHLDGTGLMLQRGAFVAYGGHAEWALVLSERIETRLARSISNGLWPCRQRPYFIY